MHRQLDVIEFAAATTLDDQFYLATQILPDYHLFGVFDAVGEQGLSVVERAAIEVQKQLPNLAHHSAEQGTHIIRSTWRSLDRGIKGELTSGAAAAVTCMGDGVLGSVGLGGCLAGYFTDNGPLEMLNQSHTIDNEEERTRLLTAGLTPEAYRRVVPKAGRAALTRAIGLRISPVTFAEATIKHYTPLKPGVLIVASQAVWGTGPKDFRQIEERVRHSSPDNLGYLARSLVDEAAIKHGSSASAVVARIT